MTAPNLSGALAQLLEQAAEMGAAKALARLSGAVLAGTQAANDRPGGPEPLAVTAAEAARRLGGVHPATVRKWIKAGKLPAARMPGGREYLVRVADLDAFLARQVTAPVAPEQGVRGSVEELARALSKRG